MKPQTIAEHRKKEQGQAKVLVQKDVIVMDAEKRAHINKKLAEIAELSAPGTTGIKYVGAFASYMFESVGNEFAKDKVFFAITSFIDL